MPEPAPQEKPLLHRSIALIVAAGRGERAGGGLPKQYRPLMGKAVLRRSVEAFLDHEGIDAVCVVIAADALSYYEAALSPYLDHPRLVAPVTGGASRQESVLRGLRALAARGAPPRFVLIHDAARPFVSRAVIGRVLQAVGEDKGAVPGLAIVDTVKRGDEAGRVETTVARAGLWRVQTPQGFPFAPILKAHEQAAGESLTDDAAVAEAAGLAVEIVPGDDDNFKITTADDFARAERLLAAAAVGARQDHAPALVARTGFGFDVHRFGPGDHVMLGGIAVPCDAGLIGHSDADVVLHAVTDAILGALALGDIGRHFPPGDPRWKGASSSVFVRHACDLLRVRGGRLANCDVTVIGERPRIAPHRDRLIANMAALLGVARSQLSVKATTTEKLGFTGRGEGLAAQAVVTVLLPPE